MNEMVQMVLDLRGFASEAVRARVAYALADVIASNMKNTDDWYAIGCNQFLLRCDLECAPAVVPNGSAVETTKMAEFINRWSNVVAFKVGDKFVDLTGDMNAIRTTMIEELKDAVETDNGSDCCGRCHSHSD